MFLNPDLGVVGAAVGIGHPFDTDADRYLDERVQVFDELASARLDIRSLTELRPSTRHGLGGEWLKALYERTAALGAHNATALAQAAENRERQRRSAKSTNEPGRPDADHSRSGSAHCSAASSAGVEARHWLRSAPILATA